MLRRTPGFRLLVSPQPGRVQCRALDGEQCCSCWAADKSACAKKHRQSLAFTIGVRHLSQQNFGLAKSTTVSVSVCRVGVIRRTRYFCRWQIKLFIAGKQKDDADGREDDYRFGWRRTRFGSRNRQAKSPKQCLFYPQQPRSLVEDISIKTHS